jgi:transcriptional regulator with GAF, ATPase, and Fis domain
MILSSDEVLSVDELWFSRESSPAEPRSTPQSVESGKSEERKIIEAALAETRGRIAGPDGAAARLRMPRSTLESKIKTLEIRKSQYKFAYAGM